VLPEGNSIMNGIHHKVTIPRAFFLFFPTTLENSESRKAYLISHVSGPLRKVPEGIFKYLGRLDESCYNSRKASFSFPSWDGRLLYTTNPPAMGRDTFH